MASIQCFLVHPTTKYRVTLRRYSRDAENRCPANGWCHNADVFIAVEEHTEIPVSGDVHPKNDTQWPTKCSLCAYVFTANDYYQKNYNCVYSTDEGKEYTLVSPDQMTTDQAMAAPPGAMWECPWMSPAPDGKSYCVRTPGGDWHIDGSYGFPQAGRWTRTGTAPNFTVTPSIGIGKDAKGNWQYHGWLRNGLLVEC
jgi:hypothetical protein